MNEDGIAKLLQAFGITRLTDAVFNGGVTRNSIVRAVNYHGTSQVHRRNLVCHCEFYKEHFTIFAESKLRKFLTGSLMLRKPGLLVTFDDGLKSNHTVAAEVLDSFGLKGFFFITVDFVGKTVRAENKPVELSLRDRKKDDGINLHPLSEDDTYMTWDHIRDLIHRGHVVGCHTMTHLRLGAGLDSQTLFREIVESKRIIEYHLGAAVTSFCWPGGEVQSYSKAAYDLVKMHYDFAFTTFGSAFYNSSSPYAIDRSNVEADMSLARVECAVSGITDIYFKRRRLAFERIVGLRTIEHQS